MKDIGLANFLGTLVTILTDSTVGEQTVAFQGLLLDFDDNFVYIDRELSGEVDTAVPIRKITAIEMTENTPEISDERGEEKAKEFAEKLEEGLKALGFDGDDDDEGGGSIH